MWGVVRDGNKLSMIPRILSQATRWIVVTFAEMGKPWWGTIFEWIIKLALEMQIWSSMERPYNWKSMAYGWYVKPVKGVGR